MVQETISNFLLQHKNSSGATTTYLSQQQQEELINTDILGDVNMLAQCTGRLKDVDCLSSNSQHIEISWEEIIPQQYLIVTEENSCATVTEATCIIQSYPFSDSSKAIELFTKEPSLFKDMSNSDHNLKNLQISTNLMCSETSKGDHIISDLAIFSCDNTHSDLTTPLCDNISNKSTTTMPTPSTSSSVDNKALQHSRPSLVQVSRSDLDRLTAETMMLKECLPMVVNAQFISCVGHVPVLEERLTQARREKENVEQQYKNLCRRNNLLMVDLEEGRKDYFSIKVGINATSNIHSYLLVSLIIICHSGREYWDQTVASSQIIMYVK